MANPVGILTSVLMEQPFVTLIPSALNILKASSLSTASSIFENSTSCQLKNGIGAEALLIVDKDDEAGVAAAEVVVAALEEKLEEAAAAEGK
jgi:uncharacterized membrane protein YGL010W